MMERARRASQYLFTLLANSYLSFPLTHSIYQGPLKRICFLGLNCYSCPAAVSACPLGALQNFLSTLRLTLSSGQLQFGAYVLGTLGIAGAWVGRMPCGWLCPFGLVQELLFRLSKIHLSLWRPLRRVPYLVLAFFVILMPLLAVDRLGYGSTWFCKLICPAGTLEAGLPLLVLKPSLRGALGWLFLNKLGILAIVIGASLVVTRPFCRSLCPLGAIYGLMNRFSMLRLTYDESRCVQCKACLKACPTEVSFFDGRDDINTGACIRCLRCLKVCPTGAVGLNLEFRKAPETEQET